MASLRLPCPKISPSLAAASQSTQKRVVVASFHVPDSRSKPALTVTAAQSQGCGRGQSNVFKACAKLNEAAGEIIPGVTLIDLKKEEEIPDSSALSAFMTQVTDLVKLVDSRDIVELQLKQLDCEVLIRKKEALPQPATSVYYTPPPAHQAILTHQLTHQLPPASATPAPAPAPVPSAPTSASTPAAPAKPKSSHPPFKCPMAGNFYRSSAPGTPPFVKVGDKVQKGQVICIIEAMKLMNEIEADQSGTVVEILAEDGKPVSVDLPLFIIEP